MCLSWLMCTTWSWRIKWWQYLINRVSQWSILSNLQPRLCDSVHNRHLFTFYDISMLCYSPLWIHDDIIYIFPGRFFVVVFVYFVGGMVFLKFVRHEEGTDIIPNRSFWGSLPGLIKVCSKFSFVKFIWNWQSFDITTSSR